MARLLSIVLTSVLLALPLAARSAPSADEYSEFLQKFDQFAKLGANKKLDGLMRDEQQVAIYWVQRTAEQISIAPNDVLYERYDALRGSWKRVYETDFPDKMEEFFAYSDINTKRERSRLKVAYDKAARSQQKAQAEKDSAKLVLVAQKFEEISKSFQTIGDKWMESQSRLNLAVALEDRWHNKRSPDLNKMTNAYARFIFLREELGVRDRWYKECVPRLKALQALGHGNEGAAEGASGTDLAPSGPELAGPAMTVAMGFEPLDGLKDLARPNYYLDMHWQIWPTVALGAVGSTAKFTRVEDSPTVIRESASKIVVDTDGDGKGDVDWPTRGKLESVTFEIGAGATKRTWSVLSEIGRQADFYQGVPMNLLPTDDAFSVYMTPAGALVGDVGGVKIQVVDDNLDGIYGSPPSKWRHMGLTGDTEQIELDSIRVGSDKRARPWSKYVNLGKSGWHRMESQNGGTTITAQAVSFKTGTMQIKAKGLKPDFFIVQGVGGEMADTYIDIAGGKKVEVPVGRWTLAYGTVRKGKKMQLMKATIFKTPAMADFDVPEGENVVVEIGAPYKFDFEYSVSGDTVSVDGKSIRVLGKSGEAYDRIYNAVPVPVAGVRKKGAKRATETATMRPVGDNDGLEKHGWPMMWKPLPVDLTKKGDEVEVQIVEKKNKLFGALESDWK